MKKVIIDNDKMLKLFKQLEKKANEAIKMEEEYKVEEDKFTKIAEKYKESVTKYTNIVEKIRTKLLPMVEAEKSKIALGEYDEFHGAKLEDGKVVVSIMTPDAMKEEYINKIKENRAKEKEDKK